MSSGWRTARFSVFGLVFGVALSANNSQVVLLACATGAAAAAVSMMAGSYLDAATQQDQARALGRRTKAQREAEDAALAQRIAARLQAAGVPSEQADAFQGTIASTPGAFAAIRAEIIPQNPIAEASPMAQGVRVALPVVAGAGAPLLFSEWRPGAQMERGFGAIPLPAGGASVIPTIIIAPIVGFDSAGYGLRYGGGFLDRTLAHIRPRPFAIGVGYPIGLISTIYPQPHDIPMDWIVTGSGALMRRPGL